MPDLTHHWYWARGAAGPSSVITSYITAEKRYGYAAHVVSFTRDADLAADRFIDALKGPRTLASRLAGFDGAYLRFAGELRIEHDKGDHLVDSHTDDALWELMYFGKAGPFRSGY
jgi:hypothetical protein